MVKDKGKLHPVTFHDGTEREYRYSFIVSLTLAQYGGGWLTPRSSCFNLANDQVPVVQEVGQKPQPVWTGAKNLAPTTIRSPGRPARNQSV